MTLLGCVRKRRSRVCQRWLAMAAALVAAGCAATVPLPTPRPMPQPQPTLPPASAGRHLETASGNPGAGPARELESVAPATTEEPTEVSRLPAAREGAVCDLPDTPVEAIRFAPNEFNLFGRGEQILDGVLACEKAGLLGEQPLRLIGYADPRGSAEFNRRLGLARAESVKRYLIRRGLPPRLLELESRGESCHLGTGPESWQLDRRVEIHASPSPAGQCLQACC